MCLTRVDVRHQGEIRKEEYREIQYEGPGGRQISRTEGESQGEGMK
jgi:hypothetical protein